MDVTLLHEVSNLLAQIITTHIHLQFTHARQVAGTNQNEAIDPDIYGMHTSPHRNREKG